MVEACLPGQPRKIRATGLLAKWSASGGEGLGFAQAHSAPEEERPH